MERDKGEKRLLNPWEFIERKSSVSYTVNGSLYFSVRSCAAEDFPYNHAFYSLSKQHQEYHKSNTKCNSES